MIVVRPSSENEIYKAFKLFRNLDFQNMTSYEVYALAREAIEKIAEQQYPDECVVGHMIMKDDLEQMESEELIQQS